MRSATSWPILSQLRNKRARCFDNSPLIARYYAPEYWKGFVLLKIVSAKVIVTCPGRNFVTLKIETSDGIAGLGDATLNGRELAVASYLTDHLIPCLIGRDAHAIEDTWQ